MRAAGPPQVKQQADAHAGDHAQFDSREKRDGYRRHVRGKIRLGVIPKLSGCLKINEAENCDDNRGGQGGDGQAV